MTFKAWSVSTYQLKFFLLSPNVSYFRPSTDYPTSNSLYFHSKKFITDWTRSVRSRIPQSVSKFRWSTIYSAIKNLKRTRMAYNSPSLYGSRNDWPSIIYRAHQNNPRTRIELLSAFYCQHKDRKDLIYLTNFINTILPKAAYPNCLLPFYTKPFDMCLFYSSLHI